MDALARPERFAGGEPGVLQDALSPGSPGVHHDSCLDLVNAAVRCVSDTSALDTAFRVDEEYFGACVIRHPGPVGCSGLNVLEGQSRVVGDVLDVLDRSAQWIAEAREEQPCFLWIQ